MADILNRLCSIVVAKVDLYSVWRSGVASEPHCVADRVYLAVEDVFGGAIFSAQFLAAEISLQPVWVIAVRVWGSAARPLQFSSPALRYNIAPFGE